MAFDIEKDGEHLLELKYAPTEYTVGIIISILGIATFIVICTVDFILKKTLLKNKLRVYEKDYFVLDDFDSENESCAEVTIKADVENDGIEIQSVINNDMDNNTEAIDNLNNDNDISENSDNEKNNNTEE